MEKEVGLSWRQPARGDLMVERELAIQRHYRWREEPLQGPRGGRESDILARQGGGQCSQCHGGGGESLDRSLER